jgi:hypothetical protein
MTFQGARSDGPGPPLFRDSRRATEVEVAIAVEVDRNARLFRRPCERTQSGRNRRGFLVHVQITLLAREVSSERSLAHDRSAGGLKAIRVREVG